MLPEVRGQRLGSRLLEARLQAAGQNFAVVSLSVSADNRAKALYERLGFARVSTDGSALCSIRSRSLMADDAMRRVRFFQ